MISTTASFASYVATAGQTVFAYPFCIQDQSDLQVFTETTAGVRSNVTGTVVSVSGVGNEGGGDVTITALPLGTKVFFVRQSTFSQLWDASALNFFDPATVERVVDKLTLLSQEAKSVAERSVRLEPGESMPALNRADRSGKALVFNDIGAPILVTRNTFAESVTDDAVAAKEAAELAEQHAEAARDQAEVFKNGAATERAAAETARAGAETARTGAQTARTGAETALTNAQAVQAAIDPAQYAKKELTNVADGGVVARLLAAGSVSLAKLAADVLIVIQNSGFDPAKYQGLWTPATNTPTIPAAAGGNLGNWYFVAAAGTAVGNAAGIYAYGDVIISTGAVWRNRPAPPTVIPDASITFPKLASEVNALMERIDELALQYAVVDSVKRIAFGVLGNGKMVGDFFNLSTANGLTLTRDTSGRQILSLGSTEGVLPLFGGKTVDSRDAGWEDGEYALAIVDQNKRIALGIKKTGKVVMKFTLTPSSLPETFRHTSSGARENAAYLVFPKKVLGYWQLFSIKKSTGQSFALTSGAFHHFDPFLTSDNRVLFFSDRDPAYSLYSVGAEGGAIFPAIPFTNIACWGDSLTAGAGGTPYPTQLGTLMLGRLVFNGGVGGETSSQILTRIQADTTRDKWSVVLWLGRNDGRDAPSVATTKANITAAVAHLKCYTNRFLIMSILNGNYGGWESVGGGGYNAMRDVYNYCVATWPNNVFDIQGYLVDNGLADAGITPTAQDLIDVGNRVVPTSLRADDIHLLTAGYGVVAARVNAFFAAKGW